MGVTFPFSLLCELDDLAGAKKRGYVIHFAGCESLAKGASTMAEV